MIKLLQRGEPREKWIHLRPELIKLMENKDNIPRIMAELKNGYQSGNTEQAQADNTDKGDNKDNGSSQNPSADDTPGFVVFGNYENPSGEENPGFIFFGEEDMEADDNPGFFCFWGRGYQSR